MGVVSLDEEGPADTVRGELLCLPFSNILWSDFSDGDMEERETPGEDVEIGVDFGLELLALLLARFCSTRAGSLVVVS